MLIGTLLLHVGLDLFLEGVWDTYGKFDALEYSGIWLIVIIMSAYGMEAAMVAGIIAAVSTYAVQSVAYQSPIRGFMPATTLRSSVLNRSTEAEAILQSSKDGRSRIIVIQLQGHLFFGNMAHFTESIDSLMNSLTRIQDNQQGDMQPSPSLPPIVAIIDCSLVLGIDSSAAQAISKLKDRFLTNHQIELCIFVSGSREGFPTEFPLMKMLQQNEDGQSENYNDDEDGRIEQINEETLLLQTNSTKSEEQNSHREMYRGSCVRDSLDEALTLAEKALISRIDPTCLIGSLDSSFRRSQEKGSMKHGIDSKNYNNYDRSERDTLIACFSQICPVEMGDGDAEILTQLFRREAFTKDEYIWKQGDAGDSVKVLVQGKLISVLENEAGTTETIATGCMIGELGLLNGDARMSSVVCLSHTATLYSMSKSSFEHLVQTQPRIARFLDLIWYDIFCF